jgi:AraC family transcriptional regulator of adaptative response/methylated-DNA-[protein]-cysteine methyltransferase
MTSSRKIRFGITESTLGAVAAACSDKGICAILLADHRRDLLGELRKTFPETELVEDAAGLAPTLTRIARFVASPATALDFPLDVRGTEFQRRVWRELRKIPAGSTASYADIARSIDAPKSVRAVAQACGANMLALAIPCHRVVRSDGALSGYRWGVTRKRALLDREAVR